MNNRGPRIDPWGTPQVMAVWSETQLPVSTKYLLSLRQDLNQFKAVSEIPTQFSNPVIRSTMLKAALRSSRTRTETFPASVFR